MSIKKVATIAGVSIATVSRFFNNPNQVSQQTRQKVEQAIKCINYTPNALAQNLRRGKTGLIIVVIPQVSSPIYETILKQLTQKAKDNNYHLLVKEAEFNSLPLDYYQQMVRCKQADGFILLAGLSDRHPIEGGKQLPIVLACEPHSLENSANQLPCITIDYQHAARDATEYLIQLGHTELAFISHNHPTLTITEQQAGFQKAMLNAGLSPSESITGASDPTLSVRQKLQKLLDTTPKISAILCSDDETAIELLHCVKTRGLKVPKDISIMGFNNVRYTEMTDPTLTTINQPMDDIGREAMDALLGLIDNKPCPTPTKKLKHSIVVRSSTSHPPS